MAIKVYGEPIQTSDMGAKPAHFQPFRPTKNKLIKTIRTQIIFFQDPAFTSISLEIWKLNSTSLWKKIGQSLSRKKNDLISMQNAVGHFYFEFERLPALRRGTAYGLVLRAEDYSGTDSSHIAWARETNPFVEHEISPIGTAELAGAPFCFSIIGDRL